MVQKIVLAGYELIIPDEGTIDLVYGRIGNGKTSLGTRNIIQDLKAGQIVYANWNVKWDGYDQRTMIGYRILGWLGLKRHFYVFPKENFHFWNFIEGTIDGKRCFPFVEQLGQLTDCKIHLDEGHIPFDSYEATKMDERKRSAVFGMRHFDRSLVIYTQRAMSVHTNLRGNTNRFFKCEKSLDFTILGKRFIRFIVTEFQDVTSSGVPDEKRLRDKDGNETGPYALAVRSWAYWGTKKHFKLFDSKYLRNNLKASQEQHAQLIYIPWREQIRVLTNYFKRNTL